MTIRINGDNHTTAPGITSSDTDTGFVFGDDDIKAVTGGTDRVKVDSSGNIGIGTTSPVSKLNVKGGSLTLEHNSASTGSGQFAFNCESNSQATVVYDDGASLVFGTASTPATTAGFSERMRIHNGGEVSMPYQPIASFSDTSAQNFGPGGPVLDSSNFYNTTWCNVGNHFNASNGRYTAPEAGVYRMFIRFSSTANANIRLRKNGTTINEAYMNGASSGSEKSVSSEVVISMNAGDYFDIQAQDFKAIGGSQHKQVTFHKLT